MNLSKDIQLHQESITLFYSCVLPESVIARCLEFVQVAIDGRQELLLGKKCRRDRNGRN
jgi:hypothetical protein